MDITATSDSDHEKEPEEDQLPSCPVDHASLPNPGGVTSEGGDKDHAAQSLQSTANSSVSTPQ